MLLSAEAMTLLSHTVASWRSCSREESVVGVKVVMSLNAVEAVVEG